MNIAFPPKKNHTVHLILKKKKSQPIYLDLMNICMGSVSGLKCLRSVKINFKQLLKGTTPKTKAEVQSDYMKNIKKDPIKYEEHKRKRFQAQTKWRNNRSDEKKAADREKNRLRMAEIR